MASSSRWVKARLSQDALRLEVRLRPDAMILSTEALWEAIYKACAPLGVNLSVMTEELAARLRSYKWGTWLTLMEGTPAAPPIDDRVELLVPVPVEIRRRWLRGQRYPVFAGDPLARVLAGAPGSAGRDLRAAALQPRPPRSVSLPQGPNTRVSEDGATLLAACDGEAIMRHLRIHVAPMRIHAGDLKDPLISETGVFVDGSVREGARIEAAADVHVQGNVSTAYLTSRSGSISVAGSVSGTPRQPSVLDAALDVVSGHVLHADLRAGGDIRLSRDARHGVLTAGGNVYLTTSIQLGLLDVCVEIGGGVIPTLPEQARPARRAEAPRFARMALALTAEIAPHTGRAPAFHPCTIEGLSADAARCRLPAALRGEALPPGALAQLKFALPSSKGQVLAVAEVTRTLEPDVVALAFLQIADRDRDRITEFSLRSTRQR